MSKRNKSAFDSLGGALSSRRRRGKGKGLASMLPSTSRKKKGRGKKKDLASHMNLGRGFSSGRRRRSSGGGIAKWAGKALRERLTPTERQQVAQEADEAIDNDQQLHDKVQDAKLAGNQTFIDRLVKIVRDRIAKRTTL
jgi:hypothetical protein